MTDFARRFAPTGLALGQFLIAMPLAAQEIELDAYPRFESSEMSAAHRVWIEEEVVWIVTDAEREVFHRLENEARRDEFTRRFWEVRDPSPGTVRNEYRELHQARLAHVEEAFGRGSALPGWQTDRGRTWVLLGKPQSVNRLPNTSSAVPIEVWFYSVDPAFGTPPFFYLIFFKDRGVGDYRLYSPAIDGPEKLLNASSRSALGRDGGGGVAGRSGSFARTDRDRAVEVLRQVDPELGNAAASLVPGESAGGTVSPLRSEMVLARVLEVPNRLMPRPLWAYRLLAGETESAVRFETLPMAATATVLFDPSGSPFVHFATRTQGDALNLNQYEDEYYVTFEVGSTLRDGELRILDERPPRTLQADLDAATARRLRGGAVAYVERLPVIEGENSLDILLENNLTRRFARASFALHVPDLTGQVIDAAAPVVALESSVLEGAYDPFREQLPFQVGQRLLIPAVGGEIPDDSAVGVFWQLFVPGTRRQPLEVSYTIRDTAGTTLVSKRLRVDPQQRSDFGVVDVFSEVSLVGFDPGTYAITVALTDTQLSYTTALAVGAAQEFVRPFLHALPHASALSVESSVVRARQLRTVGQTNPAIELLQTALRRAPEHPAALELQLELLTDAGRNGELIELIAPRLAAAPSDLDLLLRMGSAQAKLGEHYDAIRYYERALLGGAPETPNLLNSLASEYFAEGDRVRARALLQRSLDLDPAQPQVERLLAELLDSGSGRRP